MARNFNGSTDFLSYAAAILTATPITIAAWVRPTNVTGAFSIVGIGGQNVTVVHEYAMLIVNGALWALEQNNTNVQATGGSLSINTWYHCVAMFRANNDVYAFLNGVQVANNSTSRIPGAAYMNRTCIGQRGTTLSDQKFAGQIAMVTVWNDYFSFDEVGGLARGMSPCLIKPHSIVAHWDLKGVWSPEIDTAPIGTPRYPMSLNGTPVLAADPFYRPGFDLARRGFTVPAAPAATARSFAVIVG